jgi:hypothetical protein
MIAPAPTKADATAALVRLDTLLKGFPFVGPADRAVAISAILTMLDRRAMATAPLHAFTAPAAGTGKSLLVDVAAMLATGRPMPVISQGKNEEELEKRLASALLAGDAGISIDNCEYTLQGGFLCQALTQPMLNIRLLGYSRKVPTPVNAALYATGNNLEIAGDLIRRCLLCSMDAGVERPELRLFSENVIEQAQVKRGELVGAALTMLRAWHIAGTKTGLTPLGGFEEWSHRIRDALVWLGCTDSCETNEENSRRRSGAGGLGDGRRAMAGTSSHRSEVHDSRGHRTRGEHQHVLYRAHECCGVQVGRRCQ